MAKWQLQIAGMIVASIVGGSAEAASAGPPVSIGGSAFDQRPPIEPVQFRDFFDSPYGGYPYGGYRGYGYGYRRYHHPERSWTPYFQSRPAQPAESGKPPPPRKAEKAPVSTILVIGDLFADWLGYGLEDAFADSPEIGIVRKIRPNSGLVRYEARAEAPEWSQALKEVLAAEKPSAIVVMLGLNDRQPLRERVPIHSSTPGTAPAAASAKPSSDDTQMETRSYEFYTDQWAELYGKRIDDMIAVLKGKGVPVLWVGLPAIRGTEPTSDISYLDELYRAHAEKAGIPYVDVWDGFVDDKGQFALQGPDFEGQPRRLRTYDGIYFTKAGADKLAHYVEHELRRVMINRALPVAAPAPEEQSPSKASATGTRPAIGPVVPLNASSDAAAGGELLGADSRPVQLQTDPLAARVLSHGDALAAPAGRADDFSWPRPEADNDAADTLPAAAIPTNPAVSAPVKTGKGETNKTKTKKAGDAKNEASTQNAPLTARLRSRRSRGATDGAPPRPPLPIVPAAEGAR